MAQHSRSLAYQERVIQEERATFRRCCDFLDRLFPEEKGGNACVKRIPPTPPQTVRALLLRESGEYGVVEIRGTDDLARYIDGYIERIDVARGYYQPCIATFVKPRIRCYANVEGRSPSPWSNLVNVVRGAYTPLFGNIVLTSESRDTGDDADIDPYIVDLVERYAACTDEAVFLTVLYRHNHGGSATILVVPEEEDAAAHEEKEGAVAVARL